MDTKKPVQTRDGRKAGIYSTGNGGMYPLHGWLEADNVRYARSWTEKGRTYIKKETPYDLINVPEYPPLPDVKGGRLEYRGKGWYNDGKPCKYWHYLWSWAEGCRNVPCGSLDRHYAEFILNPPIRRSYTLETFPFWAVWVKEKHLKYIRITIGRVSDEGISTSTGEFISWGHLSEEYDLAGIDGIWKPGYEEVEA